MPLNRTQKRLLWALDTYGENAPYTAIYTYQVFSFFTHGVVVGSLDDLLDQIDWRKGTAKLRTKDLAIPLGEAMSIAISNARAQVRRGGWRDSGCAKLIPAVARWIQRVVDEHGQMHLLDEYWDVPVRRIARLSIMPSPTFIAQMQGLAAQIRFLCDWFLGTRPDLGRFPTWEAAFEAARLWHDQIQVSDTMAAPESTVVYEWPDGWTVAELDDWDAFRFEGGALGHCIGDRAIGYWDEYLSRTSRFFSIRDERNRPWLTIQIKAPYVGARTHGNAKVAQIKGCKNRLPGTSGQSRECPPPDPTECTRVFDFLNAAGEHWELQHDYWFCWGMTAAAVGLPEVVQRRDPWNFPVGALIRPPSPFPVEPGKATKALEPNWW